MVDFEIDIVSLCKGSEDISHLKNSGVGIGVNEVVYIRVGRIGRMWTG